MSMGVDIAGRAVQQSGTDISTGALVAGALNKYWSSRWQAKTLKMQVRATEFAAEQSKADAGGYMMRAADAQASGWQEAAMRGQRLAQDVGRVYTGAAGAGIDVSSATVRHVERTNRAEAKADMDAINANAAAQGRAYAEQAGNAMADYYIGMADAAQLRQNAKMAKSRGRMEMLGGLLSAWGFHMQQTAQNAR